MFTPFLAQDSSEDHADDEGNGEKEEEKIRFFHENALTEAARKNLVISNRSSVIGKNYKPL